MFQCCFWYANSYDCELITSSASYGFPVGASTFIQMTFMLSAFTSIFGTVCFSSYMQHGEDTPNKVPLKIIKEIAIVSNNFMNYIMTKAFSHCKNDKFQELVIMKLV